LVDSLGQKKISNRENGILVGGLRYLTWVLNLRSGQEMRDHFLYGEKGFGVFRKVLMVGSCGNHWSVTSLSSVDKTNETLKSSYKDSEDIFSENGMDAGYLYEKTGCRLKAKIYW
jgi:hypothetical protein